MREVYETEKNMYIVMEQVRGGELFDHIKTYELEEREVALCMWELVKAIQYMHECGVVHRDLKPENILIEKDPATEEVSTIKVTDFGLSKIAVPHEIMMESCGTPAYVAPEVLHKKGYCREVDMWSAGVIFYTLVCRQLPFQMSDRKQTFQMIKERDPNMSLPCFSRFIPETKDLISKMLIKDPKHRITPQEALEHAYFKRLGLAKEPEAPPKVDDAETNPGSTDGEERKMNEMSARASLVPGTAPIGEEQEERKQLEFDADSDLGSNEERSAGHPHDTGTEHHGGMLSRSQPQERHSTRLKALKDETAIDRMRHLNYLDEEDRMKKMQRLLQFNLTPEEQELLRDPQMQRLMEHLEFHEDGKRTLTLPKMKKKMQIDLMAMTEKERLKLLRKILRAKQGLPKDSEEDSSDDEGKPEYMFPEEDIGQGSSVYNNMGKYESKNKKQMTRSSIISKDSGV